MYRLRQIDVDDKVCSHVSPGMLEEIYPSQSIQEVIESSPFWSEKVRRVRNSTALAIVLFVMGLGLWSRLNQKEVWQKMTGGLSLLHQGEPLNQMSASALSKQRSELGQEAFAKLFETCCRPMAQQSQTPGAFFGRNRLMAIDGTLFNTADTADNDAAFGRSSNQYGKGAYPQVRCVLLVECGSHGVVGLHISSSTISEVHGAHALLSQVSRDMLVLVDAGLLSAGFIEAVQARGAQVLGCLCSGTWEKGPRKRLRDGSMLVRLEPTKACYPLHQARWVRIISYRITDERLGEPGKIYRLATTLLNPRTAQARALIELYHERWEVELVIDEVKTHERMQRKILRSKTAEGVRQELFGIFLAHYAVRVMMYRAACRAGIDPDRLSFTEGIFQLTEMIPLAHILEPEAVKPLLKRVECLMSQQVLPPRRLRINRREVKQVYNRYKPKKRQEPAPHPFEPGQRFEEFVELFDPLAPPEPLHPAQRDTLEIVK